MFKKKQVQFSTIALCIALFGHSLFIASCKKSSSEPPVESPDEQVTDQIIPSPPTESTIESSTEPQPVASDNSDWVPIDIELPDAMFVGTPINTQVPNLEKPLGKPRPPFLAPKGTTNVALNKPITSTDSWPIIGKVDYITNGDKSAADGHYVELAPFKQHVTIDLEDMYEIYAILVWHYHMQARVYFDVIVQVADDADFTENVRTLFNNDIDNTSELGAGEDMNYTETNEGKLIEAKGVKARYVRLYSSGNNENDLNHYIEVEVYGRLVE